MIIQWGETAIYKAFYLKKKKSMQPHSGLPAAGLIQVFFIYLCIQVFRVFAGQTLTPRATRETGREWTIF